MGLSAHASGNTEAAIEAYRRVIALARKALELKPDTPAYLATLLELDYYRRVGDQAISTIRQALGAQTENPQKYWEAMQRFEQAKKENEQIPPEDP